MATELVMPKLGLTMTEGKVIEWIRSEGDVLKKGDDVLVIETEKLSNTIQAPTDGILLKTIAKIDDVLPIAAVLAYIGEEGEAVPDAPPTASVSSDAQAAADVAESPGATPSAPPVTRGDAVKASPVAKKLASQLGIDISLVPGSGPGGRIGKEDVQAYADSAGTKAPSPASDTVPAASVPIRAESIPYSGMRQKVGEHMLASWSASPMVTHQVRADVTDLLTLRATLNEGVEDSARISITDLVVKAVAESLRAYPRINCRLNGNLVDVLADINIGVAVALPEGLIVPVVRGADRKDVYAISAEIKRLSAAATSGTLQLDEISGGTFTVSNVGMYGSVDFFSPILNPPEAAILGVGRTVRTPACHNDEIMIRSMMGLSLTFDHRIVDGAPAAEFLKVLLSLLEHPNRFLLEAR
jgi:pyruvate dehydrogenase E2 component (dihydrolipoamide acetyltransferase)